MGIHEHTPLLRGMGQKRHRLVILGYCQCLDDAFIDHFIKSVLRELRIVYKLKTQQYNSDSNVIYQYILIEHILILIHIALHIGKASFTVFVFT